MTGDYTFAGVPISRSIISILFAYLGLVFSSGFVCCFSEVILGPIGVGFLSAGLTNFIDKVLNDFFGYSPVFSDFLSIIDCRLRVGGAGF